jgi:phosphopantothenoylcysteine decarboxylase/phosphopantothenate--cysteine ligase
MGFAIDEVAARAGGRVTLVAGPVSLPTPAGVERVDVVSAGEMAAAVDARLEACDVFVATAAVADYRPAEVAGEKIKKGDDAGRTLALARNPDILADVCAREPRPLTVGFAAETENVAAQAEAKRRRKGADLICANAVGGGRGFGDVESRLEVFWEGGSRMLGPGRKQALARELVALLSEWLPGLRAVAGTG